MELYCSDALLRSISQADWRRSPTHRPRSVTAASVGREKFAKSWMLSILFSTQEMSVTRHVVVRAW